MWLPFLCLEQRGKDTYEIRMYSLFRRSCAERNPSKRYIGRDYISYYLEHDYDKKGIPLSAKTITNIAKILGVNR